MQIGVDGTEPLVGSERNTLHLFVITANDSSTVERQLVALNTYLTQRRKQPSMPLLPRLAFTLCQRRSVLPWKVALVASTADELMTRLGTAEKTAMRSSRTPNLGFVFTGQGANWQGMGRELFQAYPVFSSAMVAADEFLTSLGASWSLKGDAIDPILKSMEPNALLQKSCSMTQEALSSNKHNSVSQLVPLYSLLLSYYSSLLVFDLVLSLAIPVAR